MRAIVAKSYAGPEVLELTEIARPEPGPGDVLVRVLAAGWFEDGPYVWGWDVSGIVEAAGVGVVEFAQGDEVFGMPRFRAWPAVTPNT